MTSIPPYSNDPPISEDNLAQSSERAGILSGLAARMKLCGFTMLGLGILGGLSLLLRSKFEALLQCPVYFAYFALGLATVRAGNALRRQPNSEMDAEDNLNEGLGGLRSFFTLFCLFILLNIIVGLLLGIHRFVKS